VGIVDLRSDTVTRPTVAMRAAMAAADVGDDGWDDDPSVHALQDRVAALLGHEAALWVPSGTMANLVALRVLAAPGTEVLAEDDAHILTYELGGLALLGGIQTRTLRGQRGVLDPAAVSAGLRGRPWSEVPTAAVAIEDTHVRSGGSCWTTEQVSAVAAAAHDGGVAVHLDGARLWHSLAVAGEAPAVRAGLVDTVSVCLSKGLGAPAGSLIAAGRERIAVARRIRKQLGGTMRQVGVLAAAGLHALDHHLERLPEDHARARALAEGLAEHCDPADVRTNIVLVRAADAPAVVARAKDAGVLASATGPQQVRLVTHLDVDDDDIAATIRVLGPILSA
jgi:threonine aldolase